MLTKPLGCPLHHPRDVTFSVIHLILSFLLYMQAYLAQKYMSGPKADAILSRAAPEKKKKKRKTGAAATTSASTSGLGAVIVDEDDGWTKAVGGADEDGDDATEAVVASDRSFKKRKVVDGGEGSGWATVNEGVKKEDASPPPDEKPQVVEAPFAGGLVRPSELKKRLPGQRSTTEKEKRAQENEEDRLAQETVYRDASGRKIDTKAERAVAARKKREREEKEAQKMEWGKGLVQREDAAKRAAQLEKERNRGLAVYADDKELNQEQKSAQRWNDPAARFLTVRLFITKRTLTRLCSSLFARKKLQRARGNLNIPAHPHLRTGSVLGQDIAGMVSIEAMGLKRNYSRSRTSGNGEGWRVMNGAWTTCSE